jgi:hypothetical protein
MRRAWVTTTCVAAGMTCGGAALAQEAPEAASATSLSPPPEARLGEPAVTQDVAEGVAEATDDRWSLRAEIGAWYVGLGGDLKLPGSISAGNGQEFNLDDLGLDSPKLVPTAEANLFFGPIYRGTVRGYQVSSDQDQIIPVASQLGRVAIPAGQAIRTTFDFGSLELEAGARVWQDGGRARLDDGRLSYIGDLAVFAGLQVIDVDWSARRVSGGGESSDYEQVFVLARGGAKWSMVFREEFTVDLTIGVGASPLGDASAFTGDIIAGFAWEPHPNFGIQIGYRAAQFNLSEGDDPEEFSFTGGNQGLQAGIVLKF